MVLEANQAITVTAITDSNHQPFTLTAGQTLDLIIYDSETIAGLVEQLDADFGSAAYSILTEVGGDVIPNPGTPQQSIETIAELPTPSVGIADTVYLPRVNAAGDGFEFWQAFEQTDERTTGLINQQNATFEPYLTATYDIPVTDTYIVDFSYIFSLNSTTRNFECHLEIDGTDVYPLHIEPQDSAGAGVVLPIIAGGVEGPSTANTGTDQLLNNSGSLEVNLTAGSHTILIEFSARGGTGLEAAMHRAMLKVRRKM